MGAPLRQYELSDDVKRLVRSRFPNGGETEDDIDEALDDVSTRHAKARRLADHMHRDA